MQTDRSQSLTLKAPAKINLFLKVLGRRPDGYHDIASLMQKVALFDVLHLSRQGEAIALSCPGAVLPEGRENLVYRAASAFYAAAGEPPGVKITLEKNIPVAAGLGGGSSDAAATLLGLNRLLGGPLERSRLLDIARLLGADVPFFVEDCSSALATGIGDCLQEAEPLQGITILLVNPGFEVSTKWAYENFPLTSGDNPYILARGREMQADPAVFAEIGNDLEAVTASRYPEIEHIKKELKKAGAAASLMSGSGPTVFGLFAEEEEAKRSFLQFARRYGKNVFLVRPYIP